MAMTGHLLTAEEVFRSAWGFYKATDWLNQSRDGKIGAAQAVMEAFCLELLMKCILMIETGKVAKVHNLKDLFDKISPANQSKIKKYYDEDLGEVQSVTIQQRGKTYTSDLNGVLAATNNTFVEWRYMFEPGKDPKPILGWESLRAALLRLLLEIQPCWQKHL
jgi:hypothetical protein